MSFREELELQLSKKKEIYIPRYKTNDSETDRVKEIVEYRKKLQKSFTLKWCENESMSGFIISTFILTHVSVLPIFRDPAWNTIYQTCLTNISKRHNEFPLGIRFRCAYGDPENIIDPIQIRSQHLRYVNTLSELQTLLNTFIRRLRSGLRTVSYWARVWTITVAIDLFLDNPPDDTQFLKI